MKKGKKKVPVQLPVEVPEGSVAVKCDRCRELHIIKKGGYYTCPKSLSENTTEGWYLFESNGDVEQTSHFENVKIKLGLGH